MPVIVEMLELEPIILATFKEPFKVQVDMPLLLADVKRLRESVQQRTVVVIDMSAVNLSFYELMDALGQAGKQICAQQAAGAIMPAEYVFVGNDVLSEIAAQAMEQDQYGGIGGAMFASLDEALAHARARIATGDLR